MSDTVTEAPPSASRPVAAEPGKRNRLKIAATVLLVVFLVALPILTGSQVAYLKVAQYVLIGTVGGIGLTLLVGQAGQLSLAHPFFLLVGAVSYAVLAGDPAESEGLVGLGLPPLLAVVGAIVVYGLQQFFRLGANQFGWFADAQFGGLSAVILSAFVYGAAVVLVVLFEPGGAAAIGRRLTSRLTPRKKEQR